MQCVGYGFFHKLYDFTFRDVIVKRSTHTTTTQGAQIADLQRHTSNGRFEAARYEVAWSEMTRSKAP